MEIILASASPRRRELLATIVPDFKVIVSDVDENIKEDDPAKMAMKLARKKARAVYKEHPKSLVIGADTVVCHDGKIFGKPKDEKEALEVIGSLCGSTHQVITGVCIISEDGEDLFYETSDVRFGEPPKEELQAYIASGDPFDKAGGYGIQNLPESFHPTVSGSLNNVIGLPTEKLAKHLKL